MDEESLRFAVSLHRSRSFAQRDARRETVNATTRTIVEFTQIYPNEREPSPETVEGYADAGAWSSIFLSGTGSDN